MSEKIDISTIINTLIFFGISINFPKVINSLNKDTLCLWISIFAFIGLNLYNFNNKIRELNIKMESFDNQFKKVENHDNEINDLKVLCHALELLLNIEISKRNK